MSGSLYSRYVPPKATSPAARTPTNVLTQSANSPVASNGRQKKEKPKELRKPKKRKLEETAAIEEDDAEIRRSKQHQNILTKFDKSIKYSDKIREQKEHEKGDEVTPPAEDVELHDLVPLPQPPRTKRAPYKPDFSSLPPWLAKAEVADSKKRQFSELGLGAKILNNLKKRSYEEAFPVQATLVPLLVPGNHYYHGDICVSAPTGSGKTLAYILPLIERLKDQAVTHLSAVIVVPTRELVVQARQEAEQCAAGTKIQIGTALGSTNLVTERQQLIFRDQRYDPKKAAELQAIIKERLDTGFGDDDTLLDDAVGLLPMHVPDFRPKIDILICTPGRLVEHIRSTTGFSLQHVKYLVIDEADRLLDESFQEWVDVTLSALEARKKITNTLEGNLLNQPKYVQKIILSATMTQDLAKLAALKLQRPKLVAVLGAAEAKQNETQTSNGLMATGSVELLELPANLQEVAIPVGDGSEKPLYLLQLLTAELEIHSSVADQVSSPTIGRKTTNSSASSLDPVPRVLIFTNNNEDALRLNHLLTSMSPELTPYIGVLTKTTSKSGRKTLAAFKAGKLSLLIASDRASRGLDVPNLTDVINYDMPKSETVYIHRVGRTARAGRRGVSWTLFTDTEARWFWNSIARTSHIQRANNKVERYKVPISDSDALRQSYANALVSLKDAVLVSK